MVILVIVARNANRASVGADGQNTFGRWLLQRMPEFPQEDSISKSFGRRERVSSCRG
jgi:hypothetical protein